MRAIDSVLAQTFSDFELIVVDDCSTDDTADVVGRVSDERVSLIRHVENIGLAEARNSGIRYAQGRFVSFLDDDDELLPDKLLAQYTALKAAADQARTVVTCQVVVDDGISSDVRPRRGLGPHEPLCEYLMCGEGLMPPSAIMLTRELASTNLFPSGQRRLEDYSWLLRLEAEGISFLLIQQPLVVWNVEIERPRLSRSMGFDLAYEWLESCGASVTPRARRAFLAREVTPYVDPRGTRLRASWTILVAVVSRSISASEGLKAMLKTHLNRTTLVRLRRRFPRKRFG